MRCLIHVDGTDLYDKFCFIVPSPYNMYILWGMLGVLVCAMLYSLFELLWEKNK